MATKAKRGGMPQVGVRLPPPALAAIDAIVEGRNKKAGWDEVNRSDIIREMVMKGLAADRAAHPPPVEAPAAERAVELDPEETARLAEVTRQGAATPEPKRKARR